MQDTVYELITVDYSLNLNVQSFKTYQLAMINSLNDG